LVSHPLPLPPYFFHRPKSDADTAETIALQNNSNNNHTTKNKDKQ